MSEIIKLWKEVTEKKINENKKKRCRFCVYRCVINSSGYGKNASSYNGILCDYLNKMGHSRGCSPLECDEFVPNDTAWEKRRVLQSGEDNVLNRV